MKYKASSVSSNAWGPQKKQILVSAVKYLGEVTSIFLNALFKLHPLYCFDPQIITNGPTEPTTITKLRSDHV
jgi:hypothetical protein